MAVVWLRLSFLAPALYPTPSLPLSLPLSPFPGKVPRSRVIVGQQNGSSPRNPSFSCLWLVWVACFVWPVARTRTLEEKVNVRNMKNYRNFRPFKIVSSLKIFYIIIRYYFYICNFHKYLVYYYKLLFFGSGYTLFWENL